MNKVALFHVSQIYMIASNSILFLILEHDFNFNWCLNGSFNILMSNFFMCFGSAKGHRIAWFLHGTKSLLRLDENV